MSNQLLDAILFYVQIDQYGPIIEYLQNGYFDNDIPKEKKSRIAIKFRPYSLYERKLYKLKPNNILWQCLAFEEAIKVLINFHEGLVKGRFSINTIVKKILASGYWWPTLNKNVIEITCDIC